MDEQPSTLAQLIWLHEATVIELDTICDRYLALSPKVARQRAALHTLPFPTFRLTDSAKAPIMVKVSDLARHIDDQHEAAAKSWEHSQA